jgi:hypothetical protein
VKVKVKVKVNVKVKVKVTVKVKVKVGALSGTARIASSTNHTNRPISKQQKRRGGG